MKFRKVKRKIALVLATLLSTNLIWSNITEVQAEESEKKRPEIIKSLGDYKTYNAVVWGNHTASQADVEGRLAIKGDLNAPTERMSFDIGAAYKENSVAIGHPIIDYSVPVLLLGGKIIDNGIVTSVEHGEENKQRFTRIASGFAGITKNVTDKEKLIKEGHYYKGDFLVEDDEVNQLFEEIKNEINEKIKIVENLKVNENSQINGHLGITSTTNTKVLTNTEKGTNELFEIKGEYGSFKLPILGEEDRLIIYSNAKSVNFRDQIYYGDKQISTTIEKELVRELAPKILWVFPNAKEVIAVQKEIPGTIIAPNAITNIHGGSINGQVYTKNLNQIPGKDGVGFGAEVHNFVFDWDLFDELTPPEVVKGSFELTKVAEGTLEGLSKAIFEIRKPDGTIIEKETDENGKILLNDLELGVYGYREKTPPEGYEIIRPEGANVDGWKKFMITEEHKQSPYSEIVENKEIEKPIPPTPINGYLEIIKIDADDAKKFLAGAEFTVY
ncbi:collagen-binding domain-containing protein, partial [uncultured Clostridium sp.]|uniref:collagen-binding domain-containing protein n=1 Tax=uncultured Clostridium sp. TaxID=59620 RepID=UPI002633127B